MSSSSINVRALPPCMLMLLAQRGVQDPASVAALLEQLRASSAWQQIVNHIPEAGVGQERPQPTSRVPPREQLTPPPSADTADGPHPTVAELLAQLNAPVATTSETAPHRLDGVDSPGAWSWDASEARPVTNNYSSAPHASARPHTDQGPDYDASGTITSPAAPVPVRNVNFQEALPLLARLGEDPAFVDTVKRVRSLHFMPWYATTFVRD